MILLPSAFRQEEKFINTQVWNNVYNMCIVTSPLDLIHSLTRPKIKKRVRTRVYEWVRETETETERESEEGRENVVHNFYRTKYICCWYHRTLYVGILLSHSILSHIYGRRVKFTLWGMNECLVAAAAASTHLFPENRVLYYTGIHVQKMSTNGIKLFFEKRR